MTQVWRQKYKKLTDFIANHAEIKIRPDAVSIPGNVRPEFYQLFNTVRTTLIEEKAPVVVSESKKLSRNYLKAEGEVSKLLGLENISQRKPLHWFLRDPLDGLAGGLFDPLFNLLKGKTGIELFETEAKQNINASFSTLYGSGYEKWVSLSLVKLLESDNFFQVALREVDRSEHTFMIGQSGNTYTEKAPPPQASKHMSFDHVRKALFAVPDFIVHSVRANKYIALRTEVERSSANATDLCAKKEWLPLSSVEPLLPGLTLIYTAHNPEDISLVADNKNVCRPDLVIASEVNKDWFMNGGLDKLKLYKNSLKPTIGTYAVSRNPVIKQDNVELEEGIYVLTVGFEQLGLEPIISLLMQPEN